MLSGQRFQAVSTSRDYSPTAQQVVLVETPGGTMARLIPSTRVLEIRAKKKAECKGKGQGQGQSRTDAWKAELAERGQGRVQGRGRGQGSSRAGLKPDDGDVVRATTLTGAEGGEDQC